MKTREFGYRRTAGRAVLVAFLASIAWAEAAADVLTPGAQSSLDACIQQNTPPNLCVKQVAPSGQNLLRDCALSFCEVAQSDKLLEPEQARKLLLDILAAARGVKAATGALGNSADRLVRSGETVLSGIQGGGPVSANEWAEDALDNPVGDGYDVLKVRCKQLELSDPAGGRAACATEAKNLVTLRFASEAVRRSVQRLNWYLVEDSAACTQLLRKRYDAYFDAARFQWPWELAINSVRGAKDDAPTLCEGFKDVPSKQLIVLHPSLGFRYSAQADRKMDVALLVELIGVRRWKWEGSEAVNTRGASLVLSYANQADANKIGWGILVHVRDDISVGVVRHGSSEDNKVSLILSYDFGKLVNDDKKKACEKLFDDKACALIKN